VGGIKITAGSLTLFRLSASCANNTLFTRSSKLPANIKQMYSIYTCTICTLIARCLLDVCLTFASSCERGIRKRSNRQTLYVRTRDELRCRSSLSDLFSSLLSLLSSKVQPCARSQYSKNHGLRSLTLWNQGSRSFGLAVWSSVTLVDPGVPWSDGTKGYARWSRGAVVGSRRRTLARV